MQCTTRAPMLALILVVLLSLSTGCAELSGDPAAGPATLDASAPHVVHPTPVGYWDGVAFTDDEAASLLRYVNQASLSELDTEAGIDLRAAKSIVAAQPVADMHTLSALYFVGEVTLSLLKKAAARHAEERTLAWSASAVRG